MHQLTQSTQSGQNRLLERLPPADLERLRPHLQPVTFEYRLPLYAPYKPILYVYFPVTGVASLVNTMINGSAAEVGTIGNEGMVGVPIILGDTLSPTSVYIQVPGEGLRMQSALFKEALEHSSAMRRVMLLYVHMFFNQVAQSAACSHFHHLQQRCCRWLLMTRDRVQSEHFLLTQEFLAMMLGVQRGSVTLAANELKRLKLIDYHRGHVTIIDRAGLEKLSCECYRLIRNEQDRLLGHPLGLS